MAKSDILCFLVIYSSAVALYGCGDRAPFSARADTDSHATDRGSDSFADGTSSSGTDPVTTVVDSAETGVDDLETDTPATDVYDGGTDPPGDTSTGSGSGTGADTDTVTETEVGGDTDSTTGTDGGGDTGGDTDTVADAGLDMDAGLDSGVDRDTETDSDPSDDPVLSDLSVEDNPNSEISCYVTWTTDIPASSGVDFGEDRYRFRIRRGGAVTEHRVLVIGMRADTAYRIKAVSTADTGSGTAETTYTTGPLPDFIPEAVLGTHDPAATLPGWTLTNIHDYALQPPCTAVMYDEAGRVVWYVVNGTQPDTRGDVDVRYVPGWDGGTITMGPSTLAAPIEVDLAGNVRFTGPEQTFEDRMHHQFEKLSSGEYLTLREIWNETRDILGSRAVALNDDLDEVWEWNLFDHLVPDEGTVGDWCHANAAVLDLAGDAFYFSCRNLSTIFKARISGGQGILWRFGDGGDFAGDPAVAPEWQWFYGQHDPRPGAGGRLMIYDNGANDDRTSRFASRVVEYDVDETAMTASIVWEFPGAFAVDPWYTDMWYTPIWGSAYRLDNGNVLVAAGTRSVNRQSRIFEVTDDGRVVWEIVLPLSARRGVGIYKAERLSPPPLVRRI